MKLLKAPYSDIRQISLQDPDFRVPSQKGKVILAQIWTGPEALRFPDNQHKNSVQCLREMNHQIG